MLALKTKENIEKDYLYTRANVFLSFAALLPTGLSVATREA